jgi:hypothetical protein
VRELTQNAIEAIAETPEGRGEVIWDVDWNRFDLTNGRVFKLACIDTGIGMTGPEMLKYINMLSSSTHTQSYDANYGVGAKVAAATRNHAGLVYLSWKDGVGAMIHLWRDPATGQYGLRQSESNGKYHHWVKIEDTVKPEPIKDHGTMVILLGDDPDENTMLPPSETPMPSRWVARYLNTRYFTIPEGVTVKAREGWDFPRSNTGNNKLRTVTGQNVHLDKLSSASGRVELSNARAHWWVLESSGKPGQEGSHILSTGHMAALYQNELYELVTGRSGTARLQQFGVIFGYNRVVIYVEPNVEDEHKVVPTTARTNLVMDGEPLPWADWAAEFREDLPQEIKDLQEEVAAGATSKDHKQAIKERLNQIRELFRISRYRRAAHGNINVAPSTNGSGSDKENSSTPSGGSGGTGGIGGRGGDIYALFAVNDGDPGEEIPTDIEPPVVRWVKVADGTREPPDLDDRAAKYLAEENVILINADFRVYTDMEARWRERYSHVPGAYTPIEETVHEWFEQALIETVLGVQALSGSQEWSVENISRALSEEALTSAVMQRYHIDNSVKRTLGAKLGSLKEKAAQSAKIGLA